MVRTLVFYRSIEYITVQILAAAKVLWQISRTRVLEKVSRCRLSQISCAAALTEQQQINYYQPGSVVESSEIYRRLRGGRQ